jgi:hypothetical protein
LQVSKRPKAAIPIVDPSQLNQQQAQNGAGHENGEAAMAVAAETGQAEATTA